MLCVAQLGAMGLQEHGKLLSKRMLGTSGTSIATPPRSSVPPLGF